MLALPDEIRRKYSALPTDELLGSIELAAISTSTILHRAPATASFDESGELVVRIFKNNSEQGVRLDKLKGKSRRIFLDELEYQLGKRQAIYEAQEYKSLVGDVILGTVTHISPQGTLDVHIEIVTPYRNLELLAVCPIHQQPRNEKWNYKKGDIHHFFVNSCLPVTNGSISRVRLVVSRVARELPSRMLAKQSGISGIKCIYRAPGRNCQIKTATRIPKNHIIEVGKELGEHIDVIWTGSKKRR